MLLLCFGTKSEQRLSQGLGGQGGVCSLGFPTRGSAVHHPHSLTERAHTRHDSGSLGARLVQSCSACIGSGPSACKMKPVQCWHPRVDRELRAEQTHCPPGRPSSDHGAEGWAWAFKNPIYVRANKTSYCGKYAMDGESQYNKGRPPHRVTERIWNLRI